MKAKKVISKILKHRAPILSFRLLLGILFAGASIPKLINLNDFARAVSQYKILPGPFVGLFAVLLSGIEFIAGLFLIIGFCLFSAALVITGMTFLFIIATISVLARGLEIECGCFGPILGEEINLMTLLRQFLMLAVSCYILLYSWPKSGTTLLKKQDDSTATI